jgi:metal-sulfur cluster biosynthetic enzyme
METPTTTELTRDCAAVQIPLGTHLTLPKGTPFDVTQTLGGSYTIRTIDGLFRITRQDIDALGITSTSSESTANAAGATSAGTGLRRAEAASAAQAGEAGAITEQRVWDTLRTCYDPEIPVNIVDLGLVYEMEVRPLPSGQQRVDVKMTLTAPGCGMGGVIAGDAQQKLLMLDGIEEATVEIVWDPPWHQSRITAEGRRVLGLE